MSVVLVVMTDGRRECIAEAIPSLREHLEGTISLRVIHDDSGDSGYRQWLLETFPDFAIVGTGPREGFASAYARIWVYLDCLNEPYVFSTEDDFVLNQPVDLTAMARVLDADPYLVQLALRRQPWNEEERAAGGIVESHPDDYLERSSPDGVWLEHRRFFTTNPSLFRRSLCAQGWPIIANSEGIFTHRLLERPEARFGFWGARDSGEWCDHIGHQRIGTGY